MSDGVGLLKIADDYWLVSLVNCVFIFFLLNVFRCNISFLQSDLCRASKTQRPDILKSI